MRPAARHEPVVTRSQASVANVYDLQKVLRSDLVERVGRIDPPRLAALDEGLRLVLGL